MSTPSKTVLCERRTDAEIAARFEATDLSLPARVVAQYSKEQAELIEAGALAAWHRHQQRRKSLPGLHGMVPCPLCGNDAVRLQGRDGQQYRVLQCAVCMMIRVRECHPDGTPVHVEPNKMATWVERQSDLARQAARGQQGIVGAVQLIDTEADHQPEGVAT